MFPYASTGKSLRLVIDGHRPFLLVEFDEDALDDLVGKVTPNRKLEGLDVRVGPQVRQQQPTRAFHLRLGGRAKDGNLALEGLDASLKRPDCGVGTHLLRPPCKVAFSRSPT
jgi:hypothetical protein